jgi:hypothetical protein
MLRYKIHFSDSGLLPGREDQLNSYSLLHLVDESVRTAKFDFLKHKVVNNLMQLQSCTLRRLIIPKIESEMLSDNC